jgi:hypothetical protein
MALKSMTGTSAVEKHLKVNFPNQKAHKSPYHDTVWGTRGCTRMSSFVCVAVCIHNMCMQSTTIYCWTFFTFVNCLLSLVIPSHVLQSINHETVVCQSVTVSKEYSGAVQLTIAHLGNVHIRPCKVECQSSPSVPRILRVFLTGGGAFVSGRSRLIIVPAYTENRQYFLLNGHWNMWNLLPQAQWT